MSQATQLIAQQYRNGELAKRMFGEAFYIVTAYGIFPDGTDVTNKLQALVNLANSEGRTAIFFPHGEYTVTYINNDKNIYYFGDNASFVGGYSKTINQIGSSSSSQSVYNVKTYGAKGDGTTDDTTAISAALSAASAGGEVFFPPGTYIYSSLFSPPSNVTISGVRRSSIIKMKAGVLPTFGFINVGNISKLTVRNLSFIGNKVAPALPGQAEVAMYFLNCANILFEDCYFTGYMGIGIAFQGGSDTKVIRCRFEDHGQNLTAWRGKAPKAVPAIWAAYGNTGLVVDDCDFYDCRWSAVFMLGKNGSVNNCRMDTIGESAIYSEYSDTSPTRLNSVTKNKIENAYMIDVTACGIEWATSNSLIADNIVKKCGADGIAISNCGFVTVSNNIVSNCNQESFNPGGGIGISYKDALSFPSQGVGLSVNNNIVYDDQTLRTQTYGIYISNYGGTGGYTQSRITDNVLYNNVTAPLSIQGTVFNSNTNVLSGDEWHIPTLLNGWVAFGGDYNTAAYYKDQTGRVYLRGFIKSGTASAGTTLFNLPAGYRPSTRHAQSTISNGGGTPTPCVIDVAANGDVQIGAFAAGNNWLSLDGISFKL